MFVQTNEPKNSKFNKDNAYLQRFVYFKQQNKKLIL
jgi:hypothetical protein